MILKGAIMDGILRQFSDEQLQQILDNLKSHKKKIADEFWKVKAINEFIKAVMNEQKRRKKAWRIA